MSNTRGCPILPSHMKVQICPVDELPCYTNDWMSDCEDDLEDECYVGKAVASDLEEEMEVDKGAALMKQHTKIKKQKKQECVQNPAKKCRRSGCSLKQFKCNSDELSAKAKVPSPSKSSLFSAQTGAESEELDSLNRFFSTSDCQIQISDSENSEDSNGTSDSSVMPNTTSLPVNLSQEASTTVKNNWSINFRADYSLPNVSKSGKLKDISEEYSIKRKMIAASDSEEYNLSDELKIDSENSEDSNGTSDSSVMPNTTSLPVNLSQEASTTVKNNWSINFRADYSLPNVSKSGKLKDISEEYSIKRKMIAASDSEEYNLSDELKIDYRLTKDSEVDKIVNDIDDFSIKSKTASSNMIEFPSLQEYSPVCYISPLKMSEEASLSFTSPFKSPPTKKPISVSCTFLSPVASQRQVITLLSTPRPVSKNVIDLTDSPAT